MSATHIVSREEVMEFLDGELAPPRAMFVRAHVEGCDDCRGVADSLRSLSRAIGEWRVEPAPASLTAPVAAAVFPAPSRRAVRTPAVTRTFWRAAPWLAAAAAVVVVSYVAMPGFWPVDEFQRDGKVAGASAAAAVNGALKRDEPANERRQLPAAAPAGALDKDAFDSIQVVTGGGDARVPWNLEGGNITDSNSSQAGLVGEAKKAASVARMMVRTATLGLSTDRFDDILKRMQAVAGQHGGTVAAYQVAGSAADGRSLSATVRVPVAAMDAAIGDLRTLGTVTSESQATEEITDAHRDLAIRIDNAKREAARLNELLARQSDRLSDVLAVEQAQARVQTEIEQMAAQETAMRGRAALSTIAISVAEVRHAELALGPQPIGTRVRNALVDGLRAATESGLGAVLALVALAPTALLWILLVVPPAVVAWWAARVVRSRRTAR